MSGIDRANGHRPSGMRHLLHPALTSVPRPDAAKLPFDLDAAIGAVFKLESEVPEDAFTAQILGTEREGNGVLIDDKGLVLTIGYLIAEASVVKLATADGKSFEAAVVAYDHETGFGLVRGDTPADVKPLTFGHSAGVMERDTVIIAASGGIDHALSGRVLSKREFAGSWEYLIDEAIYTAPVHPYWSGAALIAGDGRLVGIGSLYVEESLAGEESIPGNMFVPTDILAPILEDLVTKGRADRRPRPWLGMYTADALGRLLVMGISADSPAEKAGVADGDLVVAVNGEEVSSLADMLRKVWATGDAGVAVQISVLRENGLLDLVIRSTDRASLLKLQRRH